MALRAPLPVVTWTSRSRCPMTPTILVTSMCRTRDLAPLLHRRRAVTATRRYATFLGWTIASCSSSAPREELPSRVSDNAACTEMHFPVPSATSVPWGVDHLRYEPDPGPPTWWHGPYGESRLPNESRRGKVALGWPMPPTLRDSPRGDEHEGLDILAPESDPVLAAHDGLVVEAASDVPIRCTPMDPTAENRSHLTISPVHRSESGRGRHGV